MPATVPAPAISAFTHVAADLLGVPAESCRDAAMLTGLMIAAAGAAGYAAIGAPVVKQLPAGDVAGVMLLDGCHMALHAFPDREIILVDILAPASRDARKALDVFARRLAPRQIRSEARPRG
ncbi:MAG TPA: S-adenosylmethionine decarboxylase [Gemmatimonadaceae bacterium]|nr:S-adenosylmethionine decarboxylase [Gemmatimonadaceae bacterium]